MMECLGIEVPETFEKDGEIYTRVPYGYVKEEYKNKQDVKRGLYPLSIPSSFIFKVNLKEFAHIYKERGAHGSANPEVKECAEKCYELLNRAQPWIDREFLLAVKN